MTDLESRLRRLEQRQLTGDAFAQAIQRYRAEGILPASPVVSGRVLAYVADLDATIAAIREHRGGDGEDFDDDDGTPPLDPELIAEVDELEVAELNGLPLTTRPPDSEDDWGC